MVIIMNVDKLKKMNVLANTLKQHGLAATREDAANLAGDMVGTSDEQALSRVFVEPEQSVKIEQDEPEEVQHMEPEQPAVNEDAMKNVLQSFADQFCTEINKLNEKLNQQEEQIAQFQKAIEAMNAQPAPEPEPVAVTQEPVAVSQEPEPAPVQQTIEPVVEKKEPPRSGSYESNDVSIEKFFYCGQK